jgi:hypothetical protein
VDILSAWEIIIGFVLGLLATECTEVSPWLANRLVRWSAHRWSTDPEIAAGYAEEWAAVVYDRPGKLLKLLTALGFVTGALRWAVTRRLGAVWGVLNERQRMATLNLLSSIVTLPLAALMVLATEQNLGIKIMIVGSSVASLAAATYFAGRILLRAWRLTR